MVEQWKASEGYSCHVVQTKAGNVARVHGKSDVSAESAARLERLIDAVAEHMVSRDIESSLGGATCLNTTS